MAASQNELILLPSGARTGTQTIEVPSPDLADIIEVILDLTTFSTAASLTLSIEEFVVGKNDFLQILAATALTAVGVKRLLVGPSVPTVANVSATALAPLRWRVVVTHGNGNSHTYSVTVNSARMSLRGS